ncbi:sensor histidine kinase [Erythrobacter alti]|uniref:sensor histidine kinase n=1 Tax=Erythrobacter alti TaxID=1896145 RepID=UPI0030F3E783
MLYDGQQPSQPHGDNVYTFPDRSIEVQESNHRIANSLSLLAGAINLRASAIARGEDMVCKYSIAQALREISSQVVCVGELHRRLSSMPDNARIDLNAHLYELCEDLIGALANSAGFQLIRESDKRVEIRNDMLLPVCLIVTEVVINSLKYAHPTGISGKLYVGCVAGDDGSVVVTICDDGVGLPDDFEFKSTISLGSRTIKALASRIGAESQLRSEPLGVRFTLAIPLAG